MEDFEKKLGKTISLYAENVTEEIKQAAKKIAKESVQKLRITSPKRTGRYSRSWKDAVVFENPNEIRVEIYNTQHQLTHLLENGHAKRNGGRISPRVHIKPVEEFANKKFEQSIQEAAKK